MEGKFCVRGGTTILRTVHVEGQTYTDSTSGGRNLYITVEVEGEIYTLEYRWREKAQSK